MLGFLGKMLGTDAALSKTIAVVSSGLDSLIHTDQEKSEEAAKARTEARQMVIEWMRSTQGQNIARRVIALLIVTAWLAQYMAATGLRVASVWVTSPAKYLESANVIALSAEGMIGAVMLIISFYFAAPYMGQIVSGAMEKFGKGIPKKETDQ